MTQLKLTWRKDYGDHEETDDTILWINGVPTENIISPATFGCFVAYANGNQIGIYDTRKECKQEILQVLDLNY